MVALAGALLLGALVLPAGSAAPTPARTSAPASAEAGAEGTTRAPAPVVAVGDSYVDASAPTTNYGTRPSVIADADPLKTVYLTFDIPVGTDLTGGVTLKIFTGSGHSAGVVAFGVPDTSWSETGITYATRPELGAQSGSSGAMTASTWTDIDVTSVVRSSGLVSLALQSTNDTAVNLTSREGTDKPQLVIGGASTTPPSSPSMVFVVSPVAGGPYQAVSDTVTHTGTLKFVGDKAVADLMAVGGGTVRFTAGTFDFGADYLVLRNVADIDFVGAGIDETVIRNSSSADADTEPFSFTGANRIKIREMTVSAGGPARETSDALDFDRANHSLVENVKITASRARGIVFDGKDDGSTAEHNTVRRCQISGTPGPGIHLLASSHNTVTGCRISGPGGSGVLVQQSSSVAAQPNKQSSDNVISDNIIDQAGTDGVHISTGARNRITGNTITNSSNLDAVRDGIRITSMVAGLTCDDNVVSGNVATDNQATETQAYGLNIDSAACNRTVVGPGNDFAGNRLAPIRDLGTGTIYQ